MTRNQETITALAEKNGGTVTTKEVIAALDRFYYTNGAFHIGQSLTKMVKSGILQRTKRGEYALLQKPTGKPIPVDINQLNLF